MIYFHIGIWVFTLFAWAIKQQKIALILLSFIFIFQCFPFHGIIKKKLEFIKKHKKYLKKIPDFTIESRSKCTFEYYSKALDMSPEEVRDLFSYLRYYELSTCVLSTKKKLYDYFEENSFENPLSSQGMIIISFILNTFIK